jgi:hypothetical protein
MTDLDVLRKVEGLTAKDQHDFLLWFAKYRPSQVRDALRLWGNPERHMNPDLQEPVIAAYCTVSDLWHCHDGLHCRCKDCHDSGRNSLFPDLRPIA